MFDYFRKKIVISVTSIILLVLSVYFIIIFTSYSALMHRDYTDKLRNISELYSNYVELRLNMIEDSALLFMDGDKLSDAILTHSPTIMKGFQEFLGSNVEIGNIFLYTDTEAFFYNTEYEALYRSYISDMRARPPAEAADQWMVCGSLPNYSKHLLYSHPIQDDQTIVGYLVLDVSFSSFFEALDMYTNSFTANTVALIRFPDNTFLPLVSELPQDILKLDAPFSSEAYTQSSGDIYICNQPLEEFDLCVQMMSSRLPTYKNSALMSLALLLILAAAAVLAVWGISSYGKFLTRRLERLTHRIEESVTDYGEEDQA